MRTGGAANGLYTLAGVLLTLKTSRLRGRVHLWTWAVWAAGFGLTGATLASSVTGIMIFTATLMLLFCPWAAIMGRVLR